MKQTELPFIQIFPVQWQSYLNLRSKEPEEYADRKRRFKRVAQMHFPTMKVTLNNADALLIMEFLGLKYQREPEWIISKLPHSIVEQLNLEP